MKFKIWIIFMIPIVLAILEDGQNDGKADGEKMDCKNPKGVTGPADEEKAELKSFENVAIACDAPYCSDIAKDILKKGGKIADAAIAGYICVSTVHPETSGFGGSVIAVYYNRTTQESTVISAREKAPLAANESMFDDTPRGSASGGPLSIGVPGDLRGLEEMYKRWGGGVPWSTLVEPSIRLLEDGIIVDNHFAFALRYSEDGILKSESFKNTFRFLGTDILLSEGLKYKEPKLLNTLKIIAKDGPGAFYDPQSPLGSKILEDLKKYKSIIEPEDFTSYAVDVQTALKARVDNLNLYTAGPPASGSIMAFIMRVIAKFKAKLKRNDPLTAQIMAEAFKFGYGRLGKLGDPEDPSYEPKISAQVQKLTANDSYIDEIAKKIKFRSTSTDTSFYEDKPANSGSSGTTPFTIVESNGDAIAMTGSLGNYFGSVVRSPQTGIIFNNKMGNFVRGFRSRLRNPENKIRPGRRPTNSWSPSIFTDDQGVVRLALGASGDEKIMSAVSFVAVNQLWLGMNVEEAISTRRLHHGLRPMILFYEDGYDQKILRILQSYGHTIKVPDLYACLVAISQDDNGTLWASWDPRKPGSIAGF